MIESYQAQVDNIKIEASINEQDAKKEMAILEKVYVDFSFQRFSEYNI
jgi:hypothetical protein